MTEQKLQSGDYVYIHDHRLWQEQADGLPVGVVKVKEVQEWLMYRSDGSQFEACLVVTDWGGFRRDRVSKWEGEG